MLKKDIINKNLKENKNIGNQYTALSDTSAYILIILNLLMLK